MTLTRSRLALLGATVAAAMLGGCGSSGPTNKAQIAAIVKREGTRPATICDHLTNQLLAGLGGRNGCSRQAATAAMDPTTHATAVKVHGRTATAVVVDRAGTRAISLVKENGVWKVATVG